jgi:hypothetical protein
MAPPRKDRRGGRHYLGGAAGIALRQRVYRTREYLEVDEIEGYDVLRRRVFFDDVLLITYHRFLGWGYVVAIGVAAVLLTVLAYAIGTDDRRAGLIFFALVALPFGILTVLRLALRVDAVTVFGRRSKAQIHFQFRKARAREVYLQLCRATREQQPQPSRTLSPPAAPPPEPAASA